MELRLERFTETEQDDGDERLLIESLRLLCCRFIAVSIPLNYNRKHVDMRQTILLSATWILALAVASPVMFGINNVPGRDAGECKLENDDYVLYSSVCSFFIPCPIMLLLYCGMFRGLRRWEEARKAKLRNSIQACRKLQEAAASLPPLASLPPPLPPIIEREVTDTPDEPSTFPSTDRPLNSEYKDGPVRTVSFAEIKYNPDPHRRKRAKINSRERKAMKVLPVVVGEFSPLPVHHQSWTKHETCSCVSRWFSPNTEVQVGSWRRESLEDSTSTFSNQQKLWCD